MGIPISHVEDAHKLQADAEIHLYQIFPLSGGTVYIKNDNPYTWLGNLYEGLPCAITGEKASADVSTPTPRMTIGQENLDLLPFKGLINDGYLDGARIVRHTVLLQNMLANANIKLTHHFRVKKVESYSRSRISLLLSTYSGAINQSFPIRQYVPPAFPWVEL